MAAAAQISRVGFFFESTRPQITAKLTPHLIPELANIVADYVIQGNAFLADEWRRVFGVKTEQVELDNEFYKFWFSPDQGDPTRLNCETHIGPYLCPQTASPIGVTEEFATPPVHRHRFASHIDFSYNLEALSRLIQNPREGNRSRFITPIEDFRRNWKIKSGPARILVMRKVAFTRGLPVEQQIAAMRRREGYEVPTVLIDLATIVLVHFVVTGERYLSDGSGMERIWTIGLSDTTALGEDDDRVALQLRQDGLDIDDDFVSDPDDCVIPALRAFTGHRKAF